MTGIILAGGRNSRIRTNKAFLKIEGRIIIEGILDKFRKVFEEIIVVADAIEEYRHLAVRLVKDIIPDKGSLGGIYSGLVNSKDEYNFVVACDMPFINIKLVEYMKDNCGNYDVVIPSFKRGYEALHAIYSKNCIVPIEEQLNRNNLKIIDFLSSTRRAGIHGHARGNSTVRVMEVTGDIISRFDPQLLSFFNINTDADYRRALNIVPDLCPEGMLE